MEQTGAIYNPWSTDDCAVALRNAIMLAKTTGHDMKSTEACSKIRLEEMSITKMIHLQKEISRLNDEIIRVDLEIQKRLQYHETKDITDVDMIEKRVGKGKKLLEHLQTVVTNKESIVTRLQQPHMGDCIKLEAAFHKHASELFKMLAPILSNLTSHLDNLAWVNTTTFTHNQLDNVVTELSRALACIQTHFQSLSQMSQCIRTLQSMDESSQQFVSTLTL